jgi:hypothetical protein
VSGHVIAMFVMLMLQKLLHFLNFHHVCLCVSTAVEQLMELAWSQVHATLLVDPLVLV